MNDNITDIHKDRYGYRYVDLAKSSGLRWPEATNNMRIFAVIRHENNRYENKIAVRFKAVIARLGPSL